MIYQLNNNPSILVLLDGEQKIKNKIANHLKSLSPNDRYTRFFGGISDTVIDNYVSKLNFNKDGIIVFYTDNAVFGFAHVSEIDKTNSYECGLSVDPHCRNQKIGSKLFKSSVEFARANGCSNLYINCLYQNTPMNKIVKNCNLQINNECDGTNSAKIEMPGVVDIQSLMKLKTKNTILVWDLAYKKQLNRLFSFYKNA